ncbi:hypothetical protein KKH38_00705 [Patescibacteria group bacterium]|nr:hypothetical protein [Patescibacteria group bacterium]MBU4600980.1 hypothetical protein [Patescibacteria group bacterium]
MNLSGVEANFGMYGYSAEDVGRRGSASTHAGNSVDLTVIKHCHNTDISVGANAYSGASTHGNASAYSDAFSYISVQD